MTLPDQAVTDTRDGRWLSTVNVSDALFSFLLQTVHGFRPQLAYLSNEIRQAIHQRWG